MPAESGPQSTSGRFAGGRADLTDGPEGPTLWKLTAPLALGFVINAVYSWTDMYFVSRLGDESIAALGFSEQINFVLFTLGSGFCIGTGIMVARRIGEGERGAAESLATQAMSFIAIYSTIAAIILIFALPSILSLFNLQGRLLADTEIFMVTLMFGFPGNLITFMANASVRSTGNTVFPMAVLIISALCNVIVDPILIFGYFGLPALGIQGAAISTALAQWVGAAISLYALYSGKLNIRLSRPTLRFDWSAIKSIARVGIPSSLQTLAVSTTRVAMMAIATGFGTAATAAYTIGLKVDILVFMPIFATGVAIETLVSQNIGAGRFERVKRFRQVAIRDLGLMVGLMGIIVFLGAESIAKIFTNRSEVIDLTATYLHIAVFGYFFFVVGQSATRSLSGAGHSLRSMMIVATVLLVFQVPLAWILSHLTPLGETGLFLAITVSYLAFAIVGTLAIRGDSWMRKKI